MRFITCNFCRDYLFLVRGYYLKVHDEDLKCLGLSPLDRLDKLEKFLLKHSSLRHCIFSLSSDSKEGGRYLKKRLKEEIEELILNEEKLELLERIREEEEEDKKNAKIQKEIKEFNKTVKGYYN